MGHYVVVMLLSLPNRRRMSSRP